MTVKVLVTLTAPSVTTVVMALVVGPCASVGVHVMTPLALMFAYPEDATLSFALARLAREELRHFEQVSRLMEKLDVPFERQAPSRYAAGLRRHAASAEPRRKLDLMLIGALIEARSCERFSR